MRSVAAVAAALFVLAGCTARVGGAPVADESVPAELTAEVVLGDPMTVDPCTLVDPAAFEDRWRAEYGRQENFDYCMVSVTVDDGTPLIVSVGELAEFDPETSGDRVAEHPGGLWVSQADDTPSDCTRLVVFPDDVTLAVAGTSVDASSATCDVVEVATDHVIGVLTAREVGHRVVTDRSLVTVDPCEQLSDDDVRAVPAFAAATKPNAFPARHECLWQTGEGATRSTVRLDFGVGSQPEAFQPGAASGLIGGRQSATNPYDYSDASFCAVETGHVLFAEVEGDDIVEVAGVYVRLPPGQAAAACQIAQALAAKVWPKLPKS